MQCFYDLNSLSGWFGWKGMFELLVNQSINSSVFRVVKLKHGCTLGNERLVPYKYESSGVVLWI